MRRRLLLALSIAIGTALAAAPVADAAPTPSVKSNATADWICVWSDYLPYGVCI
jgi:hypothetical protein